MRIGKVVKRVRIPKRVPVRIIKQDDKPIPVEIPNKVTVPVKRDYTP